MSESCVLAKPEVSALPIQAKLRAKLRAILNDAWSENTKRTYRSLWQRWQAWVEEHGIEEPPHEETLMLYATHLAETGAKLPTIDSSLIAIRHAYQAAGCPIPPPSGAFAMFRKGLRRQLRHRPQRKQPMTVERLQRGVEKCFLEPWERALLLWGFATGFRRSELVSLRLGDIVLEERGLQVSLSSSKTNQEGREEKIAIPAQWRDFETLHSWYEQRLQEASEREEKESGWLFPSPRDTSKHLSTKTFARLVKRIAEAQGLDPASFGGHSLRAGLATSLAEADVDIRRIAQQLRHKDPLRTTMGYIREVETFSKNPLKKL